MKTFLLIIDPQIDFCASTGSLFVPGADADMERVSVMVEKNSKKIDLINVTLDSHHVPHIAHCVSWLGRDGKPPGPFTIITNADVKSGVWRASIPELQPWFAHYVAQLESNGRYPLMTWPEHCIIGSQGAAVVPSLSTQLNNWERTRMRLVNYVPKGSHRFTEHYSAVQADVPITGGTYGALTFENDPSTSLNARLCDLLVRADRIGVCGEARSHCLANTVRDIAGTFGKGNINKLYLLTDCCSDVPNCEAMGEKFVKDMVADGMQLSTSTTFFN